MQRCAVEEAETIVNQRNATSFKHAFYILRVSQVYSGDGILMAQHREAGRLVDRCNEDLSHGTVFLQ